VDRRQQQNNEKKRKDRHQVDANEKKSDHRFILSKLFLVFGGGLSKKDAKE